MSDCEHEARIALYIEGDLTTDEAVEAERHMVDCPECARLAEELRESQAAFKSLATIVPGPEIRRRVLQTLESRRQRANWLAVAAALFVLVAAGLVWNLQQRMAVPEVALHAPQPPAPQVELPAQQPIAQAAGSPRRHRARVRRAPEPKPEPVLLARNTEPFVVKILTDDPDVVIIWLVEGKEQQNEETTFGIDGPCGE